MRSTTAELMLKLAAGLLISGPTAAYAQAWVPAEHSLGFSFGYSFGFHDTIYEGPLAVTGLSANDQQFHLGAEFVPVEHLLVSASVPLFVTQYTGEQGIQNGTVLLAHGRYDDGKMHVSLTDLTLGAGYQLFGDDGLIEFPVAVTPHIHAYIPLTKYETSGYAAPAQGLIRVSFGLDAGLRDLIVRGTYLQAGYAYSIVQRETRGGEETSSINLNRSEASTSLGYFITQDLRVGLLAHLLYTHGGVDLAALDDASPMLRKYHDPILAIKALLPGIDATYSISETVDLNAGFEMVVWGDNVGNDKILRFGVSWTPLAGE